MKRVYLPFLGEFGGELLWMVPKINADNQSKIVCHEMFKECLYPSASEHYVVRTIQEPLKETVGSQRDENVFGNIREYYGDGYEFIEPRRVKNLVKGVKWFVPKVSNFGFRTDVVLFPRKKTYRASMNWGGWAVLSEKLRCEGIRFFSAGSSDSSYDLGCPCAWDFENNLGATIWSIMNSKIRVGVITALHVLSMMCGKAPWVLTTEEGYMHPNTRSKPTLNYLNYADHLNVGYKVVPCLNSINGILDEIKKCLA